MRQRETSKYQRPLVFVLTQSAPSDEVRVAQRVLGVAQGGAVFGGDPPARGAKDRMAGGGVPFHGRAEARIDVGLARGQQTELQRTTGIFQFGQGAAIEKRRQGLGVAVAPARQNRDAVRRHVADLDRLGRAAAAGARRADADDAGIGVVSAGA